ncbi:diphthamide biosynthesis protein [Rhizoctonia solani AG-3 Rhs1AP]|uniref:2-(3-amino-3-carboxypropyl)histidine synthase subunit 1 n=1 Tax=Rhizoctonia solani AG-3 Rhs1AP TaxID=1086054 RepID=X8JRJ7_9AGAM|nr:diphthamide biosynthesis protein [Rhizoctonia solani AG-3 Rhs1AP]
MTSLDRPTMSTEPSTSKPKPRKRFVGRTSRPSGPPSSGTIANQIPDAILQDPHLQAAADQLPRNYSFEIHKTIHHVRKNGAKMVALQMPEGLQMYACTIADIIERFTGALTVIMGDVTYGACCIDDYTAVALGCDMLVHYGHSCLVPIDTTTIKTLYIFVEIAIDGEHLTNSIRMNFPSSRQTFRERLLTDEHIPTGEQIHSGKPTLAIEAPDDSKGKGTEHEDQPTRLALVSTIQFVAAVQRLKDDLSIEGAKAPLGLVTEPEAEQSTRPKLWHGRYEATIPRSKPLSPGEILGCTAPKLSNDVDAIVYVGDGRFHLEAMMIANPAVPAFRYDPYSKKLTRERYDHVEMREVRSQAVRAASQSLDSGARWGVILGTLGRQGSFRQHQAIQHQLKSARHAIPYVPILLSELSPAKLACFAPHISVFVQTSCPRLSIDWGYAFAQPLLSPYEAAVVMGTQQGWAGVGEGQGGHPMDFYEKESVWAKARTWKLGV